MTIGQGMVDGISGAMGLGDCGSEGLSWREQSKAHQKKPTETGVRKDADEVGKGIRGM